MIDTGALQRDFEQRFGTAPTLTVRAPGRVNLIGEHTDYNGGFVLPAAIDRAVVVAARRRPDRQVHMVAVRFNESDAFELAEITPNPARPWSNYVRGVARGLLAAGHDLGGADLLIDGDVPLGAGLSSSAAIEVAVAYTLQQLYSLPILAEELALLAQAAENTFVGVQSGIMDQFIAALGTADHALLIDCRDLSYRAIPIPPDVRVVICDSKVARTLATSAYNERRQQCEAAVQVLRTRLPHITQLRDVTLEQLAQYGNLLEAHLLARARHVVTENARTLEGAAALERGDVAAFGQLMNAGHASLRDDYQVSIPQLDVLVATAQQVPGCHGSRLTGAGFGGCTVSMVDAAVVDAFQRAVAQAYTRETGLVADIYVCRASDGVRVVEGAS